MKPIYLAVLAAQVKKTPVLKKRVKPIKIKDNNQSVKFGAINEKSDSNLRSSSKARC